MNTERAHRHQALEGLLSGWSNASCSSKSHCSQSDSCRWFVYLLSCVSAVLFVCYFVPFPRSLSTLQPLLPLLLKMKVLGRGTMLAALAVPTLSVDMVASLLSLLSRVQVLGTDELNSYLNKYRIELDPHLEALVGRYLLFPETVTCIGTVIDCD